MKRVQKIIFSIVLIFILFSMLCQVNARDIWAIGNGFLSAGSQQTGMSEESVGILVEKLGVDTKKGFEELIDFLWGIGLLVIVISTVILGIKYMLVLPNEKSRLMQSTYPYIVGVIIIFGALTIWKFIIMVLERVL